MMLKGRYNFHLDGSVGGAPQLVGGTARPQVSKAIDAQAKPASGPAQSGVGAAAVGG
jgi:hypothetical protein